MTTQKIPTIKVLRQDSPWAIAEKFGLHYSGDMCPVPHGGYWYSAKNWREFGYANAISISESEGVLLVESITINRVESNLDSMKKFSDFDSVVADCESRGFPANIDLLEIEGFASYCGVEVDGTITFESDNGKNWGEFPEFQIMKAVRDMWSRLYS